MARAAPDRTVAGPPHAVVHVANAIVRTLDYGTGGAPLVPPIDPWAWDRLGFTPATLDRVLEVFEADLDHALNRTVAGRL